MCRGSSVPLWIVYIKAIDGSWSLTFSRDCPEQRWLASWQWQKHSHALDLHVGASCLFGSEPCDGHSLRLSAHPAAERERPPAARFFWIWAVIEGGCTTMEVSLCTLTRLVSLTKRLWRCWASFSFLITCFPFLFFFSQNELNPSLQTPCWDENPDSTPSPCRHPALIRSNPEPELTAQLWSAACRAHPHDFCWIWYLAGKHWLVIRKDYRCWGMF